jgi:hypothetical protein
MWTKYLLCAGLLLGLQTGAAFAQAPASGDATTPTPTTRNPVLGDAGTPTPRHRVRNTHKRAAAIAKSDKQPPGVENGNQPDRAAAGGGR